MNQYKHIINNPDAHWTDKAKALSRMQKISKENNEYLSERKLAGMLGVAKSEINRMLLAGKIPESYLSNFKRWNVEKWAVYDWLKNVPGYSKDINSNIFLGFLSGKIRKRKELKRYYEELSI